MHTKEIGKLGIMVDFDKWIALLIRKSLQDIKRKFITTERLEDQKIVHDVYIDMRIGLFNEFFPKVSGKRGSLINLQRCKQIGDYVKNINFQLSQKVGSFNNYNSRYGSISIQFLPWYGEQEIAHYKVTFADIHLAGVVDPLYTIQLLEYLLEFDFVK